MQKITNFKQIEEEALRIGTQRTAFLLPADREVLGGVEKAARDELIQPVFIGEEGKIVSYANQAGFDLSNVEIIDRLSRLEASRTGLAMLFEGELDLVCKGQIPTSYIYRAIIEKEKQTGGGERIAVFSLWELVKENRLILMTDTGVNIKPDWQTKADILRRAVHFMKLFGYELPRVLVLTAAREIDQNVASKSDAEKIETYFAEEGVSCRLEWGADLKHWLGGGSEALPDIILIPHLDTGNIIVKLDFFLDVNRASVVMCSRGPVIIPSRSDGADQIYTGLALGLVVAERKKRLDEAERR